MVTGHNNKYAVDVQSDINFALDQCVLRMIQKGQDGYRPITLTLELGDPVDYGTYSKIPESKFPNELAELLLSALAKHYLSVEGDLVATVHRLQREKDQAVKQLNMLIAGIGRLGGQNDSQHERT
jgi:hypothetical protein